MKYIALFSFFILFQLNCQKKSATAPVPNPPGLEGFTLTKLPNSDMQVAVKKDASGTVIEEGFILNGKRIGAWATYYPNGNLMHVKSFYQNELHGMCFAINDRRQIVEQNRFVNGKLDGKQTKIHQPQNRLELEFMYKDGLLDGVQSQFFNPLETGGMTKVQMQTEYKKGVLDGYTRTFDTEGKITTEYLYKNGEKVSGGMK